MNFSIDALVTDLSDNDFKSLSQGFSGEFLKLVKQKEVYPYEYMNSFEKFFDDKLPDRCKFFSSLKDEYIVKNYYLHAIDFWVMFKMNTMSDYLNRCFIVSCF